MPVTWMPEGTPNGDDTFHYQGMWSDMGWEASIDITVDADPFTDAAVSIKNTSGSTQTYIFTVTLPVSPQLIGATVHGGSVAATLTDSNFDGSATMAMVDQAMYVGLIDGVSTLSLLPPSVGSLVVTVAGDSTSANANDGLPGPTLASGSVLNTISIQHKFTLTDGDRGQFNSFFVVTPEPLTVMLLGLGGLFIRKRK